MSRLPDTGPSLRRYLERAKRQAIRESNASAYNRSGISVTAEDEVTVDGALIVTGPMAVGGTLSLPAGIIDNDALTAPLVPLAVHADTTGISLAPGPNVAKLTTTITVPAGYTQALVSVTCVISAWNQTAARDELYGGTSINGVTSGWSTRTSVPANSTGFVSNSSSLLLTGVAGTFYVAATGSTDSSIWPSAVGYGSVNIDGTVIFLR